MGGARFWASVLVPWPGAPRLVDCTGQKTIMEEM